MSLGEQHIHARKRLFRLGEPFPSQKSFKKYLDYSMFLIGLIAPIALIPQAWQIFSTHSASGVSVLTWAILSFVNAMWTVYGIIHKEKALVISNLLLTILDLVIIGGVLLY